MKQSWSLDISEKIEQAKIFKEKGTDYFMSGKLNLALKMYKNVKTYAEFKNGKLS